MLLYVFSFPCSSYLLFQDGVNNIIWPRLSCKNLIESLPQKMRKIFLTTQSHTFCATFSFYFEKNCFKVEHNV